MRTIFQRAFSLALRVLPWGIAGAILFWLFHLYPPAQILSALQLVNPLYFCTFTIFYFLVVWSIDTYGVAALLSRFIRPTRGRALLAVRAATYPLSLLNYGAGQASFAFYLQRLLRISTTETIGVFTLITAVDLFWVVTLAFAGSFIGEHHILGVDITPTVRCIGYITYALVAVHLLFWLGHWENRVRGRFWQGALGWMRQHRVFRIFHEAKFLDYVRIALWRLPIHTFLVIAIYTVIRLFQGHVPLLLALGNVPIAVLIGVIPISWSGVGTSNKAMVDLLAPHLTAPPVDAGFVTAAELILAVSLMWMLANYSYKLLIGLCFLPRVQRQSHLAKAASRAGSSPKSSAA